MTDPYTSSPFIAPTASVLSQRVAQTAALLLVILSLVFLTAWILRIPSLLQILPGQTAIVLSTALCFGSIGITLLISFRASHLGRALPTTVDVTLTVSLLVDASGKVKGASVIARNNPCPTLTSSRRGFFTRLVGE